TGEGAFGSERVGPLLLINARPLKVGNGLPLDQGNPPHVKGFTTPDGRPLGRAYGFGRPIFVVDPAQGSNEVGGVACKGMGMQGDLLFAAADGEEIIASGRQRGPGVPRDNVDNAMVRISTKDWSVIGKVPLKDSNPVWVAFSSDNRYAYFTGAGFSRVHK